MIHNQGREDAKFFLLQPQMLSESVKMKFIYLQKLRSALDALGSNVVRERVQGGKLPASPTEQLVNRIVDLESEIKQCLSDLEKAQNQVEQAIFFCQKPNEIRLLRQRYLEGKEMWEIINSEDLPDSTIYGIQKRALNKVVQFMEENGLKEKGGSDNGAGQED